jgi:hypothetical protein
MATTASSSSAGRGEQGLGEECSGLETHERQVQQDHDGRARGDSRVRYGVQVPSNGVQ